MRVLHVVGARPNFIKVAPIFKALKKKYFSPPHVLLLSSEDAGPLYFLQGGRADNDKVMGMHRDIHRLIQSLEQLLKLRG